MGFWQRAATAAVAVTVILVGTGVAASVPGPVAELAEAPSVPQPAGAPAAAAPAPRVPVQGQPTPVVRDAPAASAPPAQRVAAGRVFVVAPVAPARRPRLDGARPIDRTAGETPGAPVEATEEFSFRLASFNMLGSQHTARGGDKPGFASGVQRARWAVSLMNDRGYDVAGLQEAQRDQLAVVLSSGDWKSFPDPATSRTPATAQSVVWRDDVWELVEGRSFPIPFLDQQRQQPMVLLRHRATGREMWFVNVHLAPRRDRRDGEGERNAGTLALAAQVRGLQEAGLPIAVTGDMNEHGEIYCDLTSTTALVSASGGSNSGRCLPPRRMRVDWVFGTPDLGWSGFRFAVDAQVRRVTDHTIPVVEVTVPAL